jgi:hypothetical protein
MPRIALVDDDVQTEFRGKVELGRECLRLCGFVGAIHYGRLSVVRSFRLQRADARRRSEFFRGETMVIHAGLTDGGDFRVRCKRADALEPAFRFLIDKGGVESHNRINAVEPLRDRDSPATALEARSDGDNPVHTSAAGSSYDFLKVAVKVGVVEMGVRVDDHAMIVR